MEKCFLTNSFEEACNFTDGNPYQTNDNIVVDPNVLKIDRMYELDWDEYLEARPYDFPYLEYSLRNIQGDIDAVFVDAYTAAHELRPDLIPEIDRLFADVEDLKGSEEVAPQLKAKWVAQEFAPRADEAIQKLGLVLGADDQLVDAFGDLTEQVEPVEFGDEVNQAGYVNMSEITSRLQDLSEQAEGNIRLQSGYLSHPGR